MDKKKYVNEFDIREINDTRRRANLIKEAIKIVDKLGTIDFDDMSGYDKEVLEGLIDKSKELKKNRLFRLT